ncbi:type IV secretory pathway VirB4 component [Breznakia blatticola]|uniref:Type IV secretory pathway VirB4 component n=1 Tax=Breznakia blatticola TaxID=1754012 RepID=A0A4R7ZAK2_9FIRM|nr:ATP-binding protein [Breznakia blatticola]TDW13099.1 type IV secretory pathway VirB4 component [Breznakia blatticola]
MNQKKDTKYYYYPKYVPPTMMVKGIYFYEWIIAVVIFSLCLWILGYIGLLFGLIFGSTVLILTHRSDGRENFLGQLSSSVKYIFSQRVLIKRPREDVVEIEETKVDMKSKKIRKKDKKKKPSKNKQEFMQDSFPFRSIEDGYIRMNDGRVMIFLRVNGNNLDFLSFREIEEMNKNLSKEFDRNKMKISFFIQDSTFNIKQNINFVRSVAEKSKVAFLRRLGNETASFMDVQKKTATKKANFLRVVVTQKQLATSSVDDIVDKTIKLFKDSLGLERTTQLELKQMLAIYAQRLFAEKLPDTELELEERYEEFLLVKKKREEKKIQLPGVYEFKDFITPVTTNFKSEKVYLGSNVLKTYGVSSFLASTEYNNLFAKISTLKGVTTSIHMDELSLSRFRSNVSLDVRAKGNTTNDVVDAIDAELDKESVLDSYKRIRTNNQKMFYITVYFQLVASSDDEFDILEAQFKEECDNVGVTVDPLQTKQKDAWISVNPVGKNMLDKYIKQNIPSESVANLYPFNDPSVLEKNGLPLGNITDRSEIVLFNPFTNRGANNNILILGYSGVGKTVLMWLLMQNAALSAYYIRNIDVEGICVDFIQKMGGINIDMAGNNEYAINPLQIRTPDEVENGIVDDYISEVKNFMRIYKPDWTNRTLDIFEEFLNKTYRSKDIYNSSDLKLLKPSDYPIFSDVVKIVSEAKSNWTEESIGTKDDYDEIIIGLRSCTEGADAKLFNRHTNLGGYDVDELQLINFDISKMLNSDLNRKLAQWSNVFTYISQFVNDNMKRSKEIMVFIDELHTFLKKQYMSVVEILETYERRFRKYNASFVKATQTVEELDNDDDDMKEKVKTLFSQPATKFMFHLGDIKYEQVASMMKLKSTEVEKLQEKRQGKCLMRIGSSTYDLSVMMPEWFKEVKADA